MKFDDEKSAEATPAEPVAPDPIENEAATEGEPAETEQLAAPVEVEAAAPESEAAPASAAPVRETNRQPAAPIQHIDELDAEFDTAIKAIEADEMLTDGQKRAEAVRLKSARADHRDRQQRRAEQEQDRNDSNEDRFRNQEAARHGVTRGVLDSTWEQAVADCNQQMGRFDRGAATILFRQKIAATKAKRTAPTPQPKPVTTPARDQGGKFAGAQIAPPTGSIRAAGSKRLDADAKFEKEIARIAGE